MRIDVLLFAAAKEAAGVNRVSVQLPENARASDVLTALATEYPSLQNLLKSSRLAVDCEYVTAEAPIPGSSEVALIPPVSGG